MSLTDQAVLLAFGGFAITVGLLIVLACLVYLVVNLVMKENGKGN